MGDITAIERMNYNHIVRSMSGDTDVFLVPSWHHLKAKRRNGDCEMCFKYIPAQTVLVSSDKFKPILLNNAMLN